jgi:hypothetical protein
VLQVFLEFFHRFAALSRRQRSDEVWLRNISGRQYHVFTGRPHPGPYFLNAVAIRALEKVVDELLALRRSRRAEPCHCQIAVNAGWRFKTFNRSFQKIDHAAPTPKNKASTVHGWQLKRRACWHFTELSIYELLRALGSPLKFQARHLDCSVTMSSDISRTHYGLDFFCAGSSTPKSPDCRPAFAAVKPIDASPSRNSSRAAAARVGSGEVTFSHSIPSKPSGFPLGLNFHKSNVRYFPLAE